MLVRGFPLWAIVLSCLAYWQPSLFMDLKPAIIPLLGIIMFGMGMTLLPHHFLEVGRRPGPVLLGVVLQFGLMPLAAWGISLAFRLEPALLAGMVLVGACSGGTASNVICYLARGDVALSITLTTMSTLLAIVMTPLLTLAYAGRAVDVPALSMLVTIFKLILLPVGLGVMINRLWGRYLRPLRRLFPNLSAGAIILIIAIIVALNHDNLSRIGLWLCLAVIGHNLIGLAGGYWLARLLKQNTVVARTLAIEVGMQNSGLAVALAMQYFSALAALPGALFSIWHNVSGSILAAWWSRGRVMSDE